MSKLTMHDRPFDGRLGQVCIRKEGSTLRLIAIPNPDYIPEELREEGSRLIRPTAKAEYRAMSNADYKKLLIDYGVTENPPDSFGLMAGGKTSDVNETTANASGLIGGAAGVAPVASMAASSKKDEQVQLSNIKRYAEKFYQIKPNEYSREKLETAVRNKMNLTGVDPNHKGNFKIFADNCFYKYRNLTKEEKEDLADFGQVVAHVNDVKGYDENLPSYIKLKEYSATDYGSAVIKKIAENKTFLKTFKVYLDRKGTSGASYDHIMFPKIFPLLEYFPGGEKVDPVAVIHHEFGHTMFYPKGAFNETLLGERKVVIELDNVARILNGNEPRYTYFDADETGGKTVNIINEKEIGDGKMTFDPNDASKLIERTAAQAKIWGVKKK